MKKRIVFVAAIFAVVVTGYLLLKVSGSVTNKIIVGIVARVLFIGLYLNLIFIPIDNHGSGYLGMARCFNVHRQHSCLKRNCHISAQKYVKDKTRCTSEKSYP